VAIQRILLSGTGTTKQLRGKNMAPKPEEAAAIWRVLCKVRLSKVFMLYSSTCIQAWKLNPKPGHKPCTKKHRQRELQKKEHKTHCCQWELNPGPRRPCPLQLSTPPTPSPVRNVSEETQVKKLAIIEETKFYKSAPNLVFYSRH
jgi:hypothetical protein